MLADARLQRENNAHMMKKTANDLALQQRAIDFALRKRIHEMEQALDELNWQKQQAVTIEIDCAIISLN